MRAGGREALGAFDEQARWMGLRSLFLTTTGRRSGKRRENTLYYIERGEDLVVVPSNAGRDSPPGWWLDLPATPEAEVRRGNRRQAVKDRQATEAEEAELWPVFDAGSAYYARYRQKTTRRIPLVILEPRDAEEAEPGPSTPTR